MSFRKYCSKVVLVWAISFVVLVGCQPESINSPVGTSASIQEITALERGGLLGGLLGTINRLLGAVVGLITPQSGATIHLLSSDFLVRPNAVNTSVHAVWAISQLTPSGLNGGTNRVHDFGPEGLQFQVASTLYVSYEDAGIGANNPALYRCFYYNEGTHNWEPQETVVDATNRRFIVTIHHFSRYAFGR